MAASRCQRKERTWSSFNTDLAGSFVSAIVFMTATRARQNDIDNVKQFFSSKAAEKVLKSTHIDPEQVKAAVSTLSDAELAQLASRTNKAQHDLAAGTLSDRDLIIIILAVAALVLIIVAVR